MGWSNTTGSRFILEWFLFKSPRIIIICFAPLSHFSPLTLCWLWEHFFIRWGLYFCNRRTQFRTVKGVLHDTTTIFLYDGALKSCRYRFWNCRKSISSVSDRFWAGWSIHFSPNFMALRIDCCCDVGNIIPILNSISRTTALASSRRESRHAFDNQ